jgi:hypothetical protein
LFARHVGLIGSDVTVNIQAQQELTLKKAFSIVTNAIDGERRQVEFLRIFQAFYAGEPYELAGDDPRRRKRDRVSGPKSAYSVLIDEMSHKPTDLGQVDKEYEGHKCL